MQPPIFVEDEGSLLIFGSVEEAQGYLEPFDVKSVDIEIFDADAKPIRAVVEPSNRWFGPSEHVKLVPVADASANPGRLRELILRHLSQLKISIASGDTVPLADLVELALRKSVK